MSNPFANYRKADPAPETDDQPKPETRKVTTGFPFHDPPRQPVEAFTDDDTGRVNWTFTDDMKAAYTGPGTSNGKREDFPLGVLPPNWHTWSAYLAAESRVDALADEMLEHGARITEEIRGGLVETFDWTTPLATSYLEAVDAAHAALEEARKEAQAAKKYTDPETGVGFQHLVKDRLGRDYVAQVATATRRWKDGQAVTGRPLPFVTGEAPDVQWTIDGLLPRGGSALMVGTYKDRVAADLATAVADSIPFAGREIAASGVVIIDAETPEASLRERYADAVARGATLLGFRGQAADLDVREATVRAWLAQAIGEGSLVIVDSLPTLMGVLDVNELSADAGGYLAGWTSLVVETKAAGLVMLHDAPQVKPFRARGHGSITQWSDTVWAAHDQDEITVDGAYYSMRIDQAEATPDPAKPEREGGADAATVGTRNREKVRAAVLQSPGATTTGVAASAGLTIPGATPHLNALEEAGEIRREKGKGRSIHWHPA